MPSQAQVPAGTFFAAQWTLFAVALGFLVFRLYVRVSSNRRLYSDDYFVIFAFACLLANNILWELELHSVYDSVAIANGLLIPTPARLIEVQNLLKSVLAFNFLFNCCLWAVKLSFLLFFWRLGQRVRGHRIWWWCVLAITVSAWLVSVCDFQFACSTNSIYWIIENCLNDAAVAVQARDFRINTTMDVLTDVLIMTIPILMLWNVRIAWRMKLALFGIFSLTIITIAFALIRLLVVPTGTIAEDLTWSSTWTTIEMAVSIIVACLGSFRQLYVNTHEKQGFVKAGNGSGGSRSTAPRWGFLSAFRSKLSQKSGGFSRGSLFSFLRLKTSSRNTGNSSNDQWSESLTKFNDSSAAEGHHIVPLDTIYVSSDINVDSTPQKLSDNLVYDGSRGNYYPGRSANVTAPQIRTYRNQQGQR